MSTVQSSSSLVVPVVLWGKQPPKNRISFIRPLPDGKTIITGSLDGELIVWDRVEGGSLNARMMLIGHDSRITCISPAGTSPSSTRFVSASADGQLSLWESSDGRSLDSVLSSYIHHQITPYSVRGGGSYSPCRLYCVGEYAEVVVIDPLDLNVLFTLSSRVEPDWLAAITFMQSTKNIDLVVGMSLSGMMKVWKLIDIEKKDASTPLYEDESKSVGVCEARSISWSAKNQSMLLVVAASSWQIFDLADLNRLFTVEAEETLCCGAVVDTDRVAIATCSGAVQLFQLPRSGISGTDASAKNAPAVGSAPDRHEPFVYSVLQGDSQFPFPTPVTFFFEAVSVDGAASHRVYRADLEGNLALWTVPNVSEADVMKKSSRPQLHRPLLETDLAKVWGSLSRPPPCIYDSQDERKITATLYIGAQGRLVLGRDDGSILIVYACEAVSKQLLESAAPSDVSCRRLVGHTSSVSCLLYPHEENARYDMQVLVSGARDFAVIVWNLNTGARVYRFCVQGGPILRLLIPPDNCNARILHTICSIAGDHSAALLSLKENKCLLLASRQLFPIVDVRWRPLDDFLLLKCEDESVYVWQMDTANLERVVTGMMSEEVLAACGEQVGVIEGDDEAAASPVVQKMRALRNKNISAFRRIAASGQEEKPASAENKETELPSPMSVQALNRNPDSPHVVFFNIDSLTVGLLSTISEASGDGGTTEGRSLSTILRSGRQSSLTSSTESRTGAPRIVWQAESNLYVDVARLCMSLLHAWTLDADLDAVCLKKLRLQKPIVPLSFGLVSRQGHISVLLPSSVRPSGSSREPATSDYDVFASTVRWSTNSSLTTVHLLAVISIANTMMSLKGSAFEVTRKKALARNASWRSTSSEMSEGESQLKQGWSLLAALHCCLLPDLVKPKSSYCSPRIELLARRWQDRCLEVRMASQALLTRELTRLGATGRKRLVESWAAFLPTLLDPSLSIFGTRTLTAAMNTAAPPSPQPPPIPPRSNQVSLPEAPLRDDPRMDSDAGVQQIRRNQATAIILLGVMGAEFPDEMNKMELSRATAQSLLELLIAPPSALLPFHSPLRRAAIDLIGRGFCVWQPHFDITKLLLGLLDLAASGDKQAMDGVGVLSPIADACRTARHALCLIATARPPALITALSKEVARYNSAAQHQTIQHTVTSPLLKSRGEVLRIIELLSEKQYSDVADLIIPVGDVLVHCLDMSLLKHRTLSEIFPPITKFYMVGYCANTRRIAFGGRNGSVVVHELRAGKAQTVQAHKGAITSVAFSEDGKYLATYAAEEAKLSFWQASQTFLGMGQSQLRCVRTQPAPPIFPVVSPGGTPQAFRARLVWISPKSLTLMLPNGKEHRFTT